MRAEPNVVLQLGEAAASGAQSVPTAVGCIVATAALNQERADAGAAAQQAAGDHDEQQRQPAWAATAAGLREHLPSRDADDKDVLAWARHWLTRPPSNVCTHLAQVRQPNPPLQHSGAAVRAILQQPAIPAVVPPPEPAVQLPFVVGWVTWHRRLLTSILGSYRHAEISNELLCQ